MDVRMQTLLMAVALGPLAAYAQPVKDAAYPGKPIRLVVPFPPGGTPDVQGRLLADKLAPRLGQQIVIDNRAGANGHVGMELVARAPADGYTLIIATLGTWVINPHMYKLSYDVVTDFAPVISVAATNGVLIVHPSMPVTSVADLLALARKRPGQLLYGSAGIGGYGHMSAELFCAMSKVRMTHVPYKGAAPATIDLIGGHIQLLFNSAVPSMPHIKSGRVKALATTGLTRMEIFPDLPTISEAGVPGYANPTWSAVAAPAHTPRAVIDRLNREINTALRLPEIIDALRADGSTPMGGTPEQFHEHLKAELVKFGALVKQAGVKADGS
jgi:tripartite-type tricarboxylate transporter receptor subunit TctC